jgi:hypothetical protein
MEESRGSDNTTAEQATPGFLWSQCAEQDIHVRVSLKQKATDDAFAYARQLCGQLEEGLAQMSSRHSAAVDLMGPNEIRDWMKEISESHLSFLPYTMPRSTLTLYSGIGRCK